VGSCRNIADFLVLFDYAHRINRLYDIKAELERALACSLTEQSRRQECLADTFGLVACDLEKRGRLTRARHIREMARRHRVRSIESRARALAGSDPIV